MRLLVTTEIVHPMSVLIRGGVLSVGHLALFSKVSLSRTAARGTELPARNQACSAVHAETPNGGLRGSDVRRLAGLHSLRRKAAPGAVAVHEADGARVECYEEGA